MTHRGSRRSHFAVMQTAPIQCICFSIFAGMRIGEIAALRIGDVMTPDGEVRREIKLDPIQTKGSKGRTVVLSGRVRREIDEYLKYQPRRHDEMPIIGSQRNGRAFSNSMLFKKIFELAGIRTSSHSGIVRSLRVSMRRGSA
jgi:integrase/recombinase XerD